MQIAPQSYRLRAALCVALFLAFALAIRMAAAKNGPAQPSTSTDAPVKPADSNGEPMKYIGPGSCAATSCHGSVKPVAGSRILQNEYSTWIVQDKHSHAYQALT